MRWRPRWVLSSLFCWLLSLSNLWPAGQVIALAGHFFLFLLPFLRSAICCSLPRFTAMWAHRHFSALSQCTRRELSRDARRNFPHGANLTHSPIFLLILRLTAQMVLFRGWCLVAVRQGLLMPLPGQVAIAALLLWLREMTAV